MKLHHTQKSITCNVAASRYGHSKTFANSIVCQNPHNHEVNSLFWICISFLLPRPPSHKTLFCVGESHQGGEIYLQLCSRSYCILNNEMVNLGRKLMFFLKLELSRLSIRMLPSIYKKPSSLQTVYLSVLHNNPLLIHGLFLG